jgi:uncharacterized protein (TIGR02246 family)
MGRVRRVSMIRLAAVLSIITIALPVFAANDGRRHKNEEAIRKLINDFAAARNALDWRGVSNAYAEDAEFAPFGGTPVEGRAAIEKAWSTLEGRADRKVESIRFIGPDVAVARVGVRFSGPGGAVNFIDNFVVAKKGPQRRIVIHETVLPEQERLRLAQNQPQPH